MFRLVFSLALLFFGIFSSFADDVNFKNLGFSSDSAHFMFAEYGLENENYYSKVYFVSTLNNNFLKSGVYSRVFKEYVNNKDNAEKALYELLKIINYRTQSLKINHLNKGRSIYIHVEDLSSSPQNNLSFVDFETGNKYDISINKEKRYNSSSFYITGNIKNSDGNIIRQINVGRKNYFRENIIDYEIRNIFLFPKEDGIVFVLKKIMKEPLGEKYGNYMVEVQKY